MIYKTIALHELNGDFACLISEKMYNSDKEYYDKEFKVVDDLTEDGVECVRVNLSGEFWCSRTEQWLDHDSLEDYLGLMLHPDTKLYYELWN